MSGDGSTSDKLQHTLQVAAENNPEYELTIDGLINKGGFAFVYKTQCPFTGQPRAIKISKTPADRKRVDREANLHAYTWNNLRDRSRVPQLYLHQESISYVHELDGNHFMVMDFIEGDSLSQKIRNPPPIEERILLAYDIVKGAADLQALTVVHGDYKPNNILLPDNRAVFIDFGAGDTRKIKLAPSPWFSATVGYIAPEAIRAQKHTLQSDIFSLGVTLYELITGFNPRGSDDTTRPTLRDENNCKTDAITNLEISLDTTRSRIATNLVEQVEELPAIPLLDQYHIINRRLANIIAKMTNQDPDKRYNHMQEVADEFKVYMKSVNLRPST